MKKLVAFILIILLGYGLTLFGPWYLVAAAGFVGGLIIRRQWQGLLIGFLAGFVLWLTQAWLIQNNSASDLPDRMADLFGLPNALTLWIVTAVVGGLLTGLGTAAGGALMDNPKQKRSRKYSR